ncbi:hypothetical protein [Amycolatopsis thermoflava]|uniref:hypothetical protein n=1 Tax=Amycolatopsis thermoflava TaxID=84480 RepID=UPI003812618D
MTVRISEPPGGDRRDASTPSPGGGPVGCPIVIALCMIGLIVVAAAVGAALVAPYLHQTRETVYAAHAPADDAAAPRAQVPRAVLTSSAGAVGPA